MGLCSLCAADQQVVKLVVDEIVVAPKIHLIEIETCRAPEQALEPGYRLYVGRRIDVCWSGGDHGLRVFSTVLPRTCPSARRSCALAAAVKGKRSAIGTLSLASVTARLSRSNS